MRFFLFVLKHEKWNLNCLVIYRNVKKYKNKKNPFKSEEKKSFYREIGVWKNKLRYLVKNNDQTMMNCKKSRENTILCNGEIFNSVYLIRGET